MNQTEIPGTQQPGVNSFGYNEGFDILRVSITVSISFGLLLNIIVLVAFINMKKSGHVVSVMGLTSGNISACISVLLLFLFVSNKTQNILASVLFTLLLSSYLVSATNVLCISMGRLIAVSLPFHYNKLFSVKRITVTVVFLWATSVIIHIIIALTMVNVITSNDIWHTMSAKFRPYFLTYGTVGLFATVVVYGGVILVLLKKHRATRPGSIGTVCVQTPAVELTSLNKPQVSFTSSSNCDEQVPIKQHTIVSLRSRNITTRKTRGVRQLSTRKAVGILGTLVLVHIISGMINVFASGMIGESSLSNRKTFVVAVFTMSVASTFDSLFYLITMAEVRNSLRKVIMWKIN